MIGLLEVGGDVGGANCVMRSMCCLLSRSVILSLAYVFFFLMQKRCITKFLRRMTSWRPSAHWLWRGVEAGVALTRLLPTTPRLLALVLRLVSTRIWRGWGMQVLLQLPLDFRAVSWPFLVIPLRSTWSLLHRLVTLLVHLSWLSLSCRLRSPPYLFYGVIYNF